MELKPYQQQVLDDLTRYLELLRQQHGHAGRAFQQFWEQHPRTPFAPAASLPVQPYKVVVPDAPHLCVKVPTGGGKTYLACNALRPIFEAVPSGAGLPPLVVWLVPSLTILHQTLYALRMPTHPYRLRLLTHFGGRLEVLDKQQLLHGTALQHPDPTQRQLTILVMSFDSLRTRNKEGRKLYQENGHYQTLLRAAGTHDVAPLPDADDTAAIQAIRRLRPVVIVDESHNAESELSVDMLRNLNPGFVLDLTATPRRNSNILSFVDALALKQEHMVKLPVIVRNYPDRQSVVAQALELRQHLEAVATAAQAHTGRYIRPIVLFQAQPQTGHENDTFERIREKLLQAGVPAAQIAVKTAARDELTGVNLLSPQCPIRYIITVNALKEGWDCPFAYVLASLANKSSAVDVEQIVGRVLRQPYATRHADSMLNMSYVLTASSNFLATLQRIVQGLNQAGFSEHDCQVAEEAVPTAQPGGQGNFFSALQPSAPVPVPLATEPDPISDLDAEKLAALVTAGAARPDAPPSAGLQALQQQAHHQEAALQQTVQRAATDPTVTIPASLQSAVKTFAIKPVFEADATPLRLPQFVIAGPTNPIFPELSATALLNREKLLEGFPLGKADTTIRFDAVDADVYAIDLEEQRRGEYAPRFARLERRVSEPLLEYLRSRPQAKRQELVVENLVKQLGPQTPIPDREVRRFVGRIVEDFSAEQLDDLLAREYHYVQLIRRKIQALSAAYCREQFARELDLDRIQVEPRYAFPAHIAPGATTAAITKSLYEKEGHLNGFEARVINDVANLASVQFWTRNPARTGFQLNGFLNHYPDFILRTKAGRIVLLETKGDDRDNSNSEHKLYLGKTWAQKAGSQYRYFMVFENQRMEGAHTLGEFLELLSQL